MKTSRISYTGGLRSTATHLASGNTVVTDAPVDNNGKGEAFSPTDLLATSLGNCMLTIMGIVAMKNNFPFEKAEVDITKIMKEAPRRVGEIVVEITISGHTYTEQQQQMLRTAALNCPVAKSLSAELKQTVIFNFEL